MRFEGFKQMQLCIVRIHVSPLKSICTEIEERISEGRGQTAAREKNFALKNRKITNNEMRNRVVYKFRLLAHFFCRSIVSDANNNLLKRLLLAKRQGQELITQR